MMSMKRIWKNDSPAICEGRPESTGSLWGGKFKSHMCRCLYYLALVAPAYTLLNPARLLLSNLITMPALSFFIDFTPAEFPFTIFQNQKLKILAMISSWRLATTFQIHRSRRLTYLTISL